MLGRQKQEQRKKEFKKGIDSDEARKKEKRILFLSENIREKKVFKRREM